MKQFDSFEQLNMFYPLDGKSNQVWYADQRYVNVLREEDLNYSKKEYPYGYLDKIEHKWRYWHIFSESWYNYYLFDGIHWTLGVNTWDGIVDAEEPEYGIFHTFTPLRQEYATFRSYDEALEYVTKKLKQRLEF